MKGQYRTRQRWILSAAASALMLFSVSSHAVTIEVTLVEWFDPMPPGITNLDVMNNGTDVASISWGNAPGDNSSYEIAGNGPNNFDFPDTPGGMTDFIVIGNFTHFNNVITGTSLGSVGLNLGLRILNGDIFEDTFQFLFTHNETPNVAGSCPDGPRGPSTSVCDDIIQITEPSPQTFMYAGMLFDIDLSFFLADDFTPSDSVQTEENSDNVRRLAVKITKLAVPEPATLGMLGLGLLFLAAVSRTSRSGGSR